jgi:tetratricopeptide (TPR) repeat protein
MIFRLNKTLPFKKANRKKAFNENQLNLFSSDVKILNLNGFNSFETAIKLDAQNDPAAEDFYLKSITEKVSVADSYCNLGIIESEKGDKVKAFNYFLSALKAEPAHIESHFNLGNLYFEQKDFHLAKLHYQISIEVEPGFTNPYFNLALTFLALEDIKSAEKYLQLFKTLTGAENTEDTMKLEIMLNED